MLDELLTLFRELEQNNALDNIPTYKNNEIHEHTISSEKLLYLTHPTPFNRSSTGNVYMNSRQNIKFKCSKDCSCQILEKKGIKTVQRLCTL